MRKGICMVALLSLAFYSCEGKSDNAGGDKGGEQGTILAKVNGEVLIYEDLQAQFPAEIRDQLRGEDLQGAVETWINTMLMAAEGRQMGLEKDPAVRAAIRFREADAIARRVEELKLGKLPAVSQFEIDSVYQADKDSFLLQEDVYRASHIMVESKVEADAIYNRIQKGDDFAKLAADYSIHRPSAEAGGEIGYFTEEQAAQQIDPAFAQAVKAMKPGDVSRPIKSQIGYYHIIKLLEKQDTGSSFDSTAVKTRISEILAEKRQGQAYGAFIDSLRKEANIERYPVPELDFQPLPDSQ